MLEKLKGASIVAFFVGVLAMVFYTPAKLMQGCYEIKYEVLPIRDKVVSFIPIVNVWSAEKATFGKLPTAAIAEIFFMLTVPFRFFVVFNFSGFAINLFSMLLMVFAFILCYLLNALLVFRILHTADTMSLGAQIVWSVVFPIGQYYIGEHLPTVLKKEGMEVSTFK